jgi:hypothetical protein
MKKDFIDYLIAFAPILAQIIIACFVAWVGYQQHITARRKLRLDLYQRRFAVYEATLAFYQALIDSTESESDAFIKIQKTFIRCYRESQFLFDKDSGIYQILDEWHTQSFKVTGFKQHGKDVVNDPNTFLNMNNDHMQALVYFNSAIEQLERKIEPYLDFRKIV